MRILHLFQWKLKDIIRELKIIKYQGFNAIQITPIQPNKFSEDIPWWGYYQPIDFKIGNQTGNKEDLINLCKKAKKYDIKIIADIVLNHVASKDDGSIYPHELVNKKLVENKYFWKSNLKVYNWEDRNEYTNLSIGLPSFDLSNYDLQDIIIKFLNELIDCGISGFRIDAAKHIKLPIENSDFFIRVFNSLKNKDLLFNYAEVIFENKDIINEYSKYMNVLTNCNGYNSDKLVVFPFSHDSDLEFGYTKNMSSELCISEYSILNNIFKNVLFYARPFDNTWKTKEIRDINLKN